MLSLSSSLPAHIWSNLFRFVCLAVDNEQDDEDISGEEVEGKISDIDKRLRELENMDKDGELVALKKKFTAPDSYSPRASVDRDDDDDEEEEENVMEFSVGEDDEVEDEF